jgi:hypothetical protein
MIEPPHLRSQYSLSPNEQLQQLGRYIRRDPPRLIAVFATYASPTIATPFGRYRKLLHPQSVATIGRLMARPPANRAM